MPIPISDRWYQSEYEPPEIMAMRAPLCLAYNRPNAAFGCRGDTEHYSGYHRSRSFIVNSPWSSQRLNDYSIQSTLDISEADWSRCCAFDFVPGAWGSVDNRNKMKAITRRFLEAAQERDPRLAALREIAGTLDGVNVARIRCSDGAILSPFDRSHLDHLHGSFWRSRARWNHSGIVQIMIGKENGMKMILVAEQPGAQVWLSNLIQRRPIVSVADLNNVKGQATGTHWGADIWQSGTILNVGVGNLAGWGVDVTAGNPVELTQEQLDQISEAAREGAESGDAATPDEVRQVVDQELDEAFGAAKDAD
jgi:hypothetical protein